MMIDEYTALTPLQLMAGHKSFRVRCPKDVLIGANNLNRFAD